MSTTLNSGLCSLKQGPWDGTCWNRGLDGLGTKYDVGALVSGGGFSS
jgi:hypothetical protein